MNLLSLLSPKKKPRPHPGKERPSSGQQRDSVRAEVIKLSLRDTLVRAKVPAGWIGVELVPAYGYAGGARRVHLRLILSQWSDKLVHSLVQIEQGFLRRMTLLDPRCREWIFDVTWRFAMAPAAVRSNEGWSETVMSAQPMPQERRAKPADRNLLLDPERDRFYEKEAHSDFSPTQPML
jgi:hypothetical protein